MYLDKSKEDLLTLFIQNLLPTNRGFNYYIDWTNVCGLNEFDVEIHAIDVLISIKDEDFYCKFKNLLQRVPTVISLFPLLFGLAKVDRNKLNKAKERLLIIRDEIDNDDHWEYKFPRTVSSLNDEDIDSYYDFFVKMGLKNLYQNKIKKSTWDYIIGVLVGMDSNGRKNRGGKAFELACQPIFERACKEHNLTLLVQKPFKELRKFGFNISIDIQNRKADFIVVDKVNSKAMNFEVNFYNGGGSKPEEIIDSYINRQKDLSQIGILFSLVTDGSCWNKASNQLQKGFKYLDYLQNFYMLKHGMLDEIISKEFCK